MFFLICRKAEFGLQKVSDVGTDGNAKVYNDRTQLAFGKLNSIFKLCQFHYCLKTK